MIRDRRGRWAAIPLIVALGTASLLADMRPPSGSLGTAPDARGIAGASPTSSMLLRTSYVLKASLSYRAGTISAREKIRIRNDSGSAITSVNLSVMPRAFGELRYLSGITVDGVPVSGRWTNNSNLEVQLGRSLGPGAVARIRLGFGVRASGVIGTSLEGRLSKANGIMQVSHWFPIVSSGHETRYPGDSQFTRTARRIRLDVTTESPRVRIAAPGRRVYASARRHVYEMEYTRDFAFGASPSYRVLSAASAGVTVAVYYTTGSAGSALATARSALLTYEAAFGQYRWPRLVIAQTGRPGSGNEYPGIVFVGGPLFSNREVVAHEVAHQWWYAMAGNDQLIEPWLDEGLAEFSTAYFFGGFRPYASSRPVDSTIHEFPNLPAPLTSAQPDSYDQTIYNKAARFLDGLRTRMGTASFFGALRAFFAAHRDGVMTTRAFYETMVRHGADPTYLRQFLRMAA